MDLYIWEGTYTQEVYSAKQKLIVLGHQAASQFDATQLYQGYENLHSTVLVIGRADAIIHTENKAFKSTIDTFVSVW